MTNQYNLRISRDELFPNYDPSQVMPAQSTDWQPAGGTPTDGGIIVNPYGETTVTPPTTVGQEIVQQAPSGTPQPQPIQEERPQQFQQGIPMQDSVPPTNLPIQTPNANIPQPRVYTPQGYQDVADLRQELQTVDPSILAQYYKQNPGLLTQQKIYRTGDFGTDFGHGWQALGHNAIANAGQMITGTLASPGLALSAVQGVRKMQDRAAIAELARQRGIPINEEFFAKHGLGIDDPDIRTLANATQPVRQFAQDVANGMPVQEAYNENIGQPIVEMLDYSVFSPKLISGLIHGDINFGEYVQLAGNRLLEYPIDNTIDILSLGAMALPRRAIMLSKLIQSGKYDKAAGVINDLANIRKGQKMEPIAQALEDFTKTVKENEKRVDLAKIIQSAEEGGVSLTPKEITIKNQLKDIMGSYHQLLSDMNIAKDPLRLTAAQYITRKTGIVIDEAMKAIAPFLENPTYFNSGKLTLEGFNYIKKNEKLNPALGYLKEAINGFNNGDLFPVTHADAGKARLLAEEETKGVERTFRGKMSDRVNGKATYQEIADMFNNPNYLAEVIGKPLKDRLKVNAFLETMEQVKREGNITEGDNLFLNNPEDLVKGETSIEDILKGATEQPVSPNAVPVNKKLVQKLQEYDQLANDFSSPFKTGSGLDWWYKFQRQVALGTGMYLSGNIQSSAFNTLMNSNVNLVKDMADATQTEGRLSRIAGTARTLKPVEYTGKNIVTKGLERTNKPITQIFQRFDTKQQNVASEIAINNYLSEKGIPLKDRVDFMQNLDDPTMINDIIERAQDAAGLNTNFTMVPKSLRPLVATLDPFWRWKDTAVRSTARTFKRQPIMSNLVLHKILGKAAFNQEMQGRLQINADTNIPAGHVFYDPKTGRMRKRSAILSPQAQTLTLAGSFLEAIDKKNIKPLTEDVLRVNNPVGSGVFNVFQGKDAYGNPLYRDTSMNGNRVMIDYKGKKRYEQLPDNTTQELPMQADEILAQGIRATSIPVRLLDTTGSALFQAGADLAGYDINKYNPNGNAILGSLNPNALWVNPNNPTTPDDAWAKLLGMYTETVPEKDYDKLTPQQLIKLLNSRGRGINKRIMNRNIYGGR